MKILKLWIAAVGLLGVLTVVAPAQETGPRLETPSTAFVSAGESQRLGPGQVFTFQLRFDHAPDGYGGGEINYRFEEVNSGPSPAQFAGDDQRSVNGKTELHDGQAIYTLSLPITDSMLPGKWKLAQVTLGQTVQKSVSIPKDVTFEIPRIPPVVIHLQAPGSMRAGRQFILKIRMDEYPKGLAPGCVLMLSGYLRHEVTNLAWDPSTFRVAVNAIELKPDQHSYEMSGSFEPDRLGGSWQGQMEIRAKGDALYSRRSCRSPQLQGDVRFTIVVEPAQGLVIPTSVAVTVNPSQIQLLLAEADRLRAKAEHLKEELSSQNMVTDRDILQNSVKEVLNDLERTEAAYKERGLESASARAVNIFFDDIRLSYGEALKTLASNSVRTRQTGPRLERVNAGPVSSTPRMNGASQAVLASILHNARAYYVAASSKAVTFNLDVFSEPKGALISYRQRGEAYHPLDHETDWRIENLSRAVYLIRLQKQGYEDKEVTFDAIDNTGTSVQVELKRKHGAR